MDNNIRIHFLGGAGTVTGSKYLVEVLNRKILVDCGMFQGLKALRRMNWDYLPVDVATIDAVLLTHAHLDHTGYLPRLARQEFRGKIYGTAPTLEIAEIILRDSAKIQEEEAARANRKGYSRHKPAKPLYNLKDVDLALIRFEEVAIGKWLPLFEGIKVRFQYAGHILGGSFIEIDAGGKHLVFSGDVGREEDYLLYAPQRPERADILFIESTYGGRLHPHGDIGEELLRIIRETYQEGGTLIIPSFAVERAQTVMYLLWQLRKKGLMPEMPVYMDSPMGANVLKVLHRSASWHKLTEEDCTKMCEAIHTVSDFRETWNIIDNPNPKIVIAGSGMVTGGRVLTYLTKYLERPETRVLLVGYQAVGTRGRQLQEGVQEIKIYGRFYPVKAKVVTVHGLSGHADQRELLNWASRIKNTPEKVFIVHGEGQGSDMLRVKIQDEYGWDSIIPEMYSIHEFTMKKERVKN